MNKDMEVFQAQKMFRLITEIAFVIKQVSALTIVQDSSCICFLMPICSSPEVIVIIKNCNQKFPFSQKKDQVLISSRSLAIPPHRLHPVSWPISE